ncbi:cation:proton antiporter [Vagococcus xieshaowenii]|uniref:Cation:proton antiporter n=1 Tax=Vagococcus xieshaowenii TaxID=2562451 RepID=A0AAJ5EFD3_9ENTE|nr:cation:proton antiporter [Vagococcus xieshaowenii]QCA27976.1 cation:proton antiporter [Vagococcus xieshaowenii]TFZ41257.1 cation:proton antiporter [Vagococcus xieshaowenii]
MNILLTLALIILLTKIADSFAIKLGLPSVVGSLLIGILVGPSFLDLIQNDHSIELFSHIGVVLLMFLAGVESDLKILRKHFKPSLITGLLGVVVPFLSFFLVSKVFNFSHETSMFIGLIFGATSLSITIQVLKELHFIKTKEGSIIIGAAVLDDVIVVIFLNFILNMINPNTTLVDMVPLLLKNVLFFAIVLAIDRFVMPICLKLLKQTKVPEKNVAFSLILAFFLSFLAEYIGMSDIIGAFFAGILISRTKFAHLVEMKVTSTTLSLFAPIFFVSIGLNLSLTNISENLWLIIVFSLLAVATKFVGGYLGGKIEKFDHLSSSIVGASLVSRGEMALILISLGLDKAFINDEIYASLVLVIIITTILAPIILKYFITKFRENETKNEQTATN